MNFYTFGRSLLVVLLLFSCEPTVEISNLCRPPLKGRIVSTAVPCGGVAIQILSENVPTGLADAEWIDGGAINAPLYEHVFKIYPCDVDNDLSNILAYDESRGVFEKTDPFHFYIYADTTMRDPLSGCDICDSPVSLPIQRQRIVIDFGCKDQIMIEEN